MGKIYVFLAAILLLEACKVNPNVSTVTSGPQEKTWATIRAEREREIAAHVEANKIEFSHFRDFANGKSGVPYVVFRVLPEVLPDLWDKETNAPKGVSGFYKNNFAPWRPIAQGIGWNTEHKFPADAPSYQIANLTCGACHMSQVKGQNGKVYDLIGGANTQINVIQYLIKLAETASDPRFNFENVKQKIESHKGNPDFWYGTDKLANTDKALADKLRALAIRDVNLILEIGADLIPKVKNSILNNSVGLDFLSKTKYGPSMKTAGIENFTGSFDAYGIALTKTFLTARTKGTQISQPLEPARVDIPAVWNQAQRSSAQWDNSIVPPILRNLAAEFATVGDSRMLDIRLAYQSGKFLEGLKPSPYPLEELDMAQVARGKLLADKNCTGCHSTSKNILIPVEKIGTDPNRARMFTEFFGMKVLDPVLRAGCDVNREPELCNFPPTAQVVNSVPIKAPGYAALPLAGSWATAPYFHNGSVPTMYHLLVPEERPKVFCRGSLSYDTKNMGFDWQLPCAPGSTEYDTTMVGQTSVGHTGNYLGRSWSGEENRQDREDLLAFLKSL